MTRTTHTEIQLQAQVPIDTSHGKINLLAFSDRADDPMPHLCVLNPDTDITKPLNVRVHSECLTGDLLGSYRCECGEQLDTALSYIKEHTGAVIYLRQEGRGIGLINKIKAYQKQDEGYDTAEANLILGHQADGRSYEVAVDILKLLNVEEVNLLTNNPDKMKGLESGGIRVLSRIPLEIPPREGNRGYLKTKKDFFGHLISI